MNEKKTNSLDADYTFTPLKLDKNAKMEIDYLKEEINSIKEINTKTKDYLLLEFRSKLDQYEYEQNNLLLETKEKLTVALHKKLNQLTNAKLQESNERAELMSSDLSEKIEGKITEKAKVAFCDKTLKPQVENIAWLENDIGKIRRQIELCNDKINLCKYIIRELELSK